MKKGLIAFVFAVLMAGSVMAQDKFLVAVGASGYADTELHTQGSVALLVPVSDDGKNFSYTSFETRGPAEGQPTQSTRTGFARLVKEFGRVKVFGLTDSGVSTGADNVAFSWSGGGAAIIKVKENFKLLVGGEGQKSDQLGGWRPVIKVGLVFGNLEK